MAKIRETLELQPGGFYTFKALLERCGEEDAEGTGVLKPSFLKKMFLILMETYRLHISDAGFQRLFEKYENAYGMVQYKKLVQNIRGS